LISGPDRELLQLVPTLYCISTSKLSLFFAYNIVFCHRYVAKTAKSSRRLIANFYQRYWGFDWPVARPSEITCACWWWTLWTHAVKLLFICIMWFIRTLY